jgi:hypothetical protein
MVSRLALLSLFLVACSACGDDGPNNPIDASPDVDVPGATCMTDIDNGSCGDQLRFTGEYVDWDVEDSFCGIFEAQFEVQGGKGAMDGTEPNGRFDMCIPADAAQTILDITMSLDNSQCTIPASTYPLDAIAVATPAVIRCGALWSGRNFTAVRQATLGVTLDPGKAHVFVHVEGAPRQVALSATHDPSQAVTGTDWAAGDTGTDIFFPNVDIAGGSTMLSATGGAVGTGAIPLVANKITNVTLFAE